MSNPSYRPASNDLCHDTLAAILAGGNGRRLGQLTRWHAKPALPFGGHYRNIDFPLSNCVNSGIRRIGLLTQYKAHSLIQHVHQGWAFLRPEIGEFIEVWPAQQRTGASWYHGTADAVYQNIDIIEEHAPAYVLVLAGDHVYRMDYLPMLEAHVASGADVTIGSMEVPIRDAGAFGVLAIDAARRVTEFTEKPLHPKPLVRQPSMALASMGIYVFSRSLLVDVLREDAARQASSRDFGHDLLPNLIEHRRVCAYPFRDEATGQPAYWRDVGTVDSYWQANMDLLLDPPSIDLSDRHWPIWTHQAHVAPARFCAGGSAKNSIVASGCEVAGTVSDSVLFTSSSVAANSRVEASLLLPGARVGRNCILRRAIIDSGAVIKDGSVIGDDPLDDMDQYHVSSKGIVLVTADMLAAPLREPRRWVA